MFDQFNMVNPRTSIAPGNAADDTPVVGAIIDQQGFQAATYLIASGALATGGASFAVLLEHGDDPALGDAAPVPDNMLLGSEADAGFTGGDDDSCFKLGYVGDKRYHRLTITPSGNAGGGDLGAICLMGHPAQAPTDNPPS